MKKVRKVILGICIFVLIASLSGLAVYLIRLQQEKEEAARLAAEAEEAVTEEVPETGETDAAEGETVAEEEKYVSPIDFESLWEENEDIYAWIRIEDTVIDYPVLESDPEDPDYYLMRNVDGSSGYPGALFTESDLNEQPFEDNVTVIYGHNMKDGSMFGSLRKWEDDTYRDEHRTIEVFTPEAEYTYTIAFVQLYDNRNILYTYDCNDEEGYGQFLDSLKNTRMIPHWQADDLDLTTDEKLVILSTCSNNDRLLVGGVLTEDGEPVKTSAAGASEE